MFGNGFFSGVRMKLMSAFLTGLFASTSVLFSGEPQVIISEIKKEIRSDGMSYSFQASEDFDDVAYYKQLFGSVKSPEMKQILSLYDDFTAIYKDAGFKDVDGYGSSVAKAGNLYDMDFFVHMKPGNEKSIIWKVMGGPSKPLKTFDLLPESTVLAKTFRLDLSTLWSYIKTTVPKLKIPDAPDLGQQLEQAEKMAAQSGFPIEAITKALSAEASIFITKNEGKTMQLPNMPPLPQLGATLIIEKKSDFVQNYMLQILANAPTQKLQLGDFSVVTVNQMLPTGTKAGIAYNNDHFIISSDIKIVKDIVSAKAGKSLVNSAKFAKYKNVSRTGNGAMYISSEISDSVSEVIKTLPPEIGMAVSSYSVMFFQDKTPEFFGVMSKKNNGLKLDMLSTFNLPGASTSGLVVVGVVGILAAMILPALGNARMKAKQAKSKSNLKNMGTTVAIYFADGVSSTYPKDWKKLEIPKEIIVHPGTDRPVSLDDFFNGKGDYIPLFKVGEQYTGAANKPLFMEKPGLWKNGMVFVVFEDGHVEGAYGSSKKEVLEWFK